VKNRKIEKVNVKEKGKEEGKIKRKLKIKGKNICIRSENGKKEK
jgi:hypothetical protein